MRDVEAWIDQPAWRRAATWVERLAARDGRAGRSALGIDDAVRARRLLDRWRAQPPFDDSRWWRRRLEHDGLGALDDAALVPLVAGVEHASVPTAWASC